MIATQARQQIGQRLWLDIITRTLVRCIMNLSVTGAGVRE